MIFLDVISCGQTRGNCGHFPATKSNTDHGKNVDAWYPADVLIVFFLKGPAFAVVSWNFIICNGDRFVSFVSASRFIVVYLFADFPQELQLQYFHD